MIVLQYSLLIIYYRLFHSSFYILYQILNCASVIPLHRELIAYFCIRLINEYSIKRNM